MKTNAHATLASILRWLGVVALPAVLMLSFLWAGGWLTPSRLTQAAMLDALQKGGGMQSGFRRNHAKGICVTGWFDGNGNASILSTATVLQKARVPVIGRFALAGGLPYQADAPGKVRSMALRLSPSDGQEWRMGINDIPVFPVGTPQEFHDLQLAARPDPTTGKPDPARMRAFLTGHPWLQPAMVQIGQRTVSSGFGDDTYYSLDSFLLVAEGGTKTAIRWAMVPVQPAVPDGSHANDHDYLFHQIIDDIHAHPLQWRLMVTLASKDDAIDNPSKEWSQDDRQIDAGTLTLTGIESEENGACTGITFDPLVLPKGIMPSADPILPARSAVYMRSFYLRSGEHPTAPAISHEMTIPSANAKDKKS
ncbi:catalase family peroxidase [Gluconobacter wancherniae]|uniref:Catalase-related peroxidase n=1 Tax=Gluconobacter wancherniae NBRC 103581 TaxID=656744 RepID=A0A511AXY2_9PROT|nr:catalase family peroxidase [Gluconobacter wancherniae]MBF0853241.1 catalase family peroxidase [Gluconobacter wancherniae]GBD56030.1 catalase-related peroxidase [Gluconobacter wancherniae NBRC 103581]GBR63059.1 catalase [Gluconobacter wancherniae NBRC 103581]GEK93068.1 catalase-related peroxidase [Gluconobacter wancherniae NBRC 103581]